MSVFDPENSRVNDYRNTHKRCKYCIHLKMITREYAGQSLSWYECKAKDKHITFPNSFPRRFCTCFHLKYYYHTED